MKVASYPSLKSISVRQIVATGCVLFVALSVWQNYLLQVNNDGILYVKAARLFAEGKFAEAKALYKWNFYPLLVGEVSRIAGSDPLVTSRILNICASALTLLVILRSAWMSEPSRRVLLCAMLLTFGNVWLNDLRAVVVREHFYFLMMMLGFYCLLRDLQSPSWAYKVGFLLATTLAGLFRIEAFAFVVLVPLLRILFETSSRLLRMLSASAILAALAASVLVVAFWFSESDLAGLFSRPASRIEVLREQVLWPHLKNRAHLAYNSMVGGIVVFGLINALGLATLALFGFGATSSSVVRRSPPFYLATLFLAIGILIVVVQVYFAMVFDYRYALILSLILTVPAAIGGDRLIAQISNSQAVVPKALATFAALVLLYGLISGLKVRDSRASQLEAARWIALNIPKEASIISNNSQVLFYAGFGLYDEDLHFSSVYGSGAVARLRDWKRFDVVALELNHGQLAQIPELNASIGSSPVITFFGRHDSAIVIYKTR